MSTWAERIVEVPEKTSGRRTFKGRSMDERRAERRVRLIEAGIQAFGEHGYKETTVREICQRAELTERYFYESFENLPALFKAVFAKLSLEISQRWMTAVMHAPRDPLAMAEAFLRAFFSFVQEEPQRARVLLYESNTVDEDVLRFAESTIDDHANTTRGFISLLYPELMSRGIDLDQLAHNLVGANVYVAGHWLRQGFRTPLEEVVRQQLFLYQALTTFAVTSLGLQPLADAPEVARKKGRPKVK
jgi:AcrR family transcriptional regulator